MTYSRYEPAFFVPRERDLQRRQFYIEKIWKPVLRHCEEIGSERKLQAELPMLHEYQGQIFYESGDLYEVPCMKKLFGKDERATWLYNFKKVCKKTGEPISISPLLQRLEVLYLYCVIRDHEINSWD